MRHFAIYERRRSRLAVWGRRLAVFALAVAILAIALHRVDAIDPPVALATLVAVAALAALAILVSFGGIVRIWRRGHLGLGSALMGLFVGIGLLAWPLYLGWQMEYMPAINDIATDWADPPEMRAAVVDRSDFSNPVRMPTRDEIEEQRAAYPEIGPLLLNAPSQRVYEAAKMLAGQRGWKILSAAPPDEIGPGRLEMVARTMILGFRDDVVVIVTYLGEGRTRVDMRSASRFGAHDFGTNAQRIFDFLTELDTTLRTGVLL